MERSRIVMLRALAALSGLDVAAGLTNAGRVQYPYRHCTRSTSPGRRCRTENLELNSAGLALPGELRRSRSPKNQVKPACRNWLTGASFAPVRYCSVVKG